MKNIESLIPGILLTFALALPAKLLGTLFPLIGGPVFALVIGICLAEFSFPKSVQQGVKFTSKKILQYAIILLGFEMNLFNIFKTGSSTFFIMIGSILSAFIMAFIFGKLFKVDKNPSILIGVGTAICGGSAIAATAPVIQASEKEVAYSISTIFLFNLMAVFLFPPIGHLLQMTNIEFGIFAGTAVNDTSSVLATAYSYSTLSGTTGTIVKLTRTLMIIPVTLLLSLLISSQKKEKTTFDFKKIFPFFVIWFLGAACLTSIGIIPHLWGNYLGDMGKFLIMMAMAAIGLNTHLRDLVQYGFKPILLGLICWLAVTLSSLLMILA